MWLPRTIGMPVAISLLYTLLMLAHLGCASKGLQCAVVWELCRERLFLKGFWWLLCNCKAFPHSTILRLSEELVVTYFTGQDLQPRFSRE